MSELILGHQRPEALTEEQEREVNNRLGDLDPLLFLRWIPTGFWNTRHGSFEGRYALCCRWPQADKRWAMFQRGEIGESFDILGWFTTDMHSANATPTKPEEVWNLTMKLLASADNELIPWRKRLANAAEANRLLKIKNRQDFLSGEGHELIADARREAFSTQTVSVGIDLKGT